MAKKTRTQLSADASNVNILDNTSQQVTPAKVRNQYTDERDSVINYVDDFDGSVGDLLTIGTDGESITWIPVSDVQTPPGGSTGDIQINAGGGNFGATTDIVITSGNVSIPNGNLSVDGNLTLESSLPILSLKDSDTINSAGRIDFKDGTNSLMAQIGYNSTDGFDFTTTSSFTFDGGDATFSGDIIASSGDIYLGASLPHLTLSGGSNGSSGGQIQLNGEGASAANDIIFLVSGTEVGRWDDSGNHWEFSNNNFVEIGNATFSGDVKLESNGTGGDGNEGTNEVVFTEISGGVTDTRGARIVQYQNGNDANNIGLRFKTATNSTSAPLVTSLDLNSTIATFSGNLALSAYGSGTQTGTATYALGVDASGNVIETSALTAGGVWTPTFSALSSNLTSVICPGGNTAFYQRVGNIVSFSVNVNITYSSSGNHVFDVSLPISSNFTDSSSVAGVVSSTFNNTSFSGGGVTCDATDALQVNLQTTGSGSTISGIMLSGHYEIK